MIAQDEIDSMTVQERLALIEQLWDSLSDQAVPLTEAQRQELERRLETFDQEKSKAVTWDEIKADWDARKR
ncbi:MAG: addiction module protein [Hyphomonadaceae bacterium]